MSVRSIMQEDIAFLLQVCEDLSFIWNWILVEKLKIQLADRNLYSAILVLPETFDSRGTISEILSIIFLHVVYPLCYFIWSFCLMLNFNLSHFSSVYNFTFGMLLIWMQSPLVKSESLQFLKIFWLGKLHQRISILKY